MTLAEKLILSYGSLIAAWGIYKLGHNTAQLLLVYAHAWADKISAAAAISS